MKSRRVFLANTSMAATALVFSSPFKSFSAASLFSEPGSAHKIVFLHSGSNPQFADYAIEKMALLTRKHPAAVRVPQAEETFSDQEFKILQKGNIKTGLIHVTDKSSLAGINQLAQELKKDYQCQLVVCLSSLGFKQKNGTDDLKLAEKSTDIDIVIGNHPTNHCPNPYIARNSHRGEVIIHHATNNGFGLGSIEVSFDPKTPAKCAVAINNHLSRLPENA
ncbi:MAG: hypothetical protein IPG86_08910 [Chitinophagaceae bacterium]|nr:hypothetical protein [Chitinophagaceae bacterium]